MENFNTNTINTTGAIFSPVDIRDYRLACASNSEDLPDEFELTMPKVKNQKNVGSCVAHSIALTIEYFNTIQNNNKTLMSTNYIYGNRTGMFYNGKGMYTRSALSNACKYGDVAESDFPGNTEVPNVIDEFEDLKNQLYDKGVPCRFSSYYSVKRENEIKTALMQNGPVVFAMNWYDDMKVINGVLHTNYQGDMGGHCMVIYGWTKNGWLIQNSWGKNWGNNGRAILPYDMKIKEAYGIVDNIINDVDVVKPYSGKFGKMFAKIINWILNLFTKKE